MKRCAYLLILLLTWAQIDDVCVVALASPSAPTVDDDAEYLPAQRRLQDEQSSAQEPVFVSPKPQTADLSTRQSGVPWEWNLTTPFTPPPLYVFMSLQI